MFVLLGVSTPVAVWSLIPKFFTGESLPNLVMAEVTLGPFINRVLELGEIESSSSVEVRCEVRSRASSGTNILEIVPEGSRVKEGDFLIRLDDAALKQELIQQQISCSGSESLAIEAKANLAAATLALKEYEEGTFREQRETLEGALVVAKENLRRAQEYLHYSKKLAERGYVSKVQLQADEFAVEKATKEREVAQTKLDVLTRFTRNKMLTQLQADIETARARLEARDKTWELDKVRLSEIQDQIKKCEILAPAAGQVVYANDPRRSSSAEMAIAEGVPVRERQMLVRLPDPQRMRVLAKVHESRISQVRPGLTTEIIADALPDKTLTGTVASVSEYPLPSTSIYTAHVKEYAVEINIHSPPPELRPGMSAQVSVMVEHLDSQLQIPIGAAIARGDRYFVAIQQDDEKFETREIKVGQTNESSIIIREGLEVGDKVVLNHSEIKDKLDLPDETPQVPEPTDATKSAAPAESTPTPVAPTPKTNSASASAAKPSKKKKS